jgi:hypothetical protein
MLRYYVRAWPVSRDVGPANQVKYCIIGSYAVAFYARPQYTKDIDILIEPSVDNSQRVVRALNEFGFESSALSAADFRKKGNIIQLGYEPVRAGDLGIVGAFDLFGCN